MRGGGGAELVVREVEEYTVDRKSYCSFSCWKISDSMIRRDKQHKTTGDNDGNNDSMCGISKGSN